MAGHTLDLVIDPLTCGAVAILEEVPAGRGKTGLNISIKAKDKHRLQPKHGLTKVRHRSQARRLAPGCRLPGEALCMFSSITSPAEEVAKRCDRVKHQQSTLCKLDLLARASASSSCSP